VRSFAATVRKDVGALEWEVEAESEEPEVWIQWTTGQG